MALWSNWDLRTACQSTKEHDMARCRRPVYNVGSTRRPFTASGTPYHRAQMGHEYPLHVGAMPHSPAMTDRAVHDLPSYHLPAWHYNLSSKTFGNFIAGGVLKKPYPNDSAPASSPASTTTRRSTPFSHPNQVQSGSKYTVRTSSSSPLSVWYAPQRGSNRHNPPPRCTLQVGPYTTQPAHFSPQAHLTTR